MSGRNLTNDELLVLFEMTHRWESEGRVDNPIDDGERVALGNLTAALEPLIDEALASNYSELLEAAKSRLVGP